MGLGDCFGLEAFWNTSKAGCLLALCSSVISFLAAAEGQGTEASEELQLRSVSFFVSCEATTGECAAVRHSAAPVMRIKCLERYVLTIIFSPLNIWQTER